MIYVMYQMGSLLRKKEEIIKSIQADPDGLTNQAVGCIKIDYTADFESRMSQYAEVCPNYRVLYSYSDGTEEDASRLRKVFNQLIMEDWLNSTDWFMADQCIVQFFKRNNTIQKVRQELDALEVGRTFLYSNNPFLGDGDIIVHPESAFNIELNIKLTEWAQCIIDHGLAKAFLDDEDVSVEKLLKVEPFSKYGVLTIPEDIYTTLRNYKPTWSRKWQMLVKRIVKEHLVKKCPPSYLTSVELLNSDESFYTKYKWFCENKELNEEAKLDIMTNYLIDNSYFSEYFRVLGSAGFIKLRFNKQQIALNYRLKVNSSIIKYLVSQKFREGCIYSNVHIKKTLQDIYKRAGCSEYVPKPEELSQWFNVKPCIITDSATKTPMNGFEIVSLKS